MGRWNSLWNRRINNKEYLIDIEKAKTQGVLKEKDNRPRSWEEYGKKLKKSYLSSGYDLQALGAGGTRYDSFSFDGEARAFLALGKLIQLRDVWWGDWKDDTGKYSIINYTNKVCLDYIGNTSRIFVFPTEEMACDFIDTFRDLIEEAKMFL